MTPPLMSRTATVRMKAIARLSPSQKHIRPASRAEYVMNLQRPDQNDVVTDAK